MSLMNKILENSANIAAKNEQVADEIINWFKERLNSQEYENYLEQRCTDKDCAIKRSVLLEVEFWQYHEGCSPTQFRTSGYTWRNPECPSGYNSNYYKGVYLKDIQNIVGPKLLDLTVKKLRDLGFYVWTKSKENWLQYYHYEITIEW